MSFLRRSAHRAVEQVQPGDAHTLLTDDALLIDVREPHEWAAGHIPNARHIPLDELSALIGTLPTDRPIIVSCRSGRRSAHAAYKLITAGLDARNLAGGLTAWQLDGLPIITDTGGPGHVA